MLVRSSLMVSASQVGGQLIEVDVQGSLPARRGMEGGHCCLGGGVGSSPGGTGCASRTPTPE